jgi:hypothetical protein
MAQVVLLVFSGLVALATAVYAVLTWQLVKETRRLREAQTEPRVSIRAELSDYAGHGGMDLVIRNEGQGPAQNVRFGFVGEPSYFDEKRPINELPVIKNGLPYLGPNQTFRFLMGWLFGDKFTRANQSPWTFHVTYENQVGKLRKDTYVVDFSQFAGLIVGGRAPLHDIAKHLETIEKEIKSIGSGSNKIHVVTQTKQQEREEWSELMNNQKQNGEPDLREGENAQPTSNSATAPP